MEILNTKVTKTEKEEYVEDNGEITTYTILHIPQNEKTRKLLYSENVFILDYSQREGSQTADEIEE